MLDVTISYDGTFWAGVLTKVMIKFFTFCFRYFSVSWLVQLKLARLAQIWKQLPNQGVQLIVFMTL